MQPGKIKSQLELFEEELAIIDQAVVEIDGKKLKPSKCFHIQLDPPHVLFNENCPETLQLKIEELLKRYTL
jgi:hypothetical protein